MSRDTTLLHPTLQAKLQQFLTACKASGLNVLVTETLRTVAEQDAKYAQGRTKAGPVVTNAKGSSYSSQHQWGIAFDFCKNVKGQEYTDTAFFKQCGAIAKSLGLGWGGDWKNPVDMPHVYLKDWGSTASTLKSKYGTPDKFKATWGGAKPVDSTPTTSTNTAKPQSNVPSFSVGKNYTLQSEMKVRTGAGTNYRAKKNSELTSSGRKHDKDKDGALDKGTVVTCQEVKKVGNDIWIKCPSGWIAAYYSGKIYVK